MKPIKIDNFTRYQEIVDRYGKKGCISNDFIQREAENLILQGSLYEYCGENNAFLLVRKNDFWRMYYYINFVEEILVLDGEEMVTEILFRGNMGEPSDVIDYLERCGFTRNLVRDLFELRYKDLSISRPFILPEDVLIRKAESIEEAAFCADLFNSVFDRFSGDYVSDEDSLSLERLQAAPTDFSPATLPYQKLENPLERKNTQAMVPPSRQRPALDRQAKNRAKRQGLPLIYY